MKGNAEHLALVKHYDNRFVFHSTNFCDTDMYTMEELKTWWEVPAIAHFFSLFKSCFSLTDFTIEELEESLLTDGEDDKSTTFTSRLLTELLQGCYDNPSISVTSYHETLIHIMKKRWEEKDGRVNPLSFINADFHSLPTLLKVQIIHRLTEYRLDASDVESKLIGLNPSDLRLEPLGADRNGSKYWYFFGVRLYKATPPKKKPKIKKRKHEHKPKKKESKKPKLHSGTINKTFLKLVNGETKSPFATFDDERDFDGVSDLFSQNKDKKKSKKKHKLKKEKSKSETAGFRFSGLSQSKWEVVCYNIDDWKDLASRLGSGDSPCEAALCRLITDNFLPNLPKIVEDMEMQKLQKEQMEQLPRRSSYRLLAKKLYEEDDEVTSKCVESLKVKREEREEQQSKERDVRMKSDFEAMLQLELERKRKEARVQWQKELERRRQKRLDQGLPPESDSSSDESFILDVPNIAKSQPPPPPAAIKATTSVLSNQKANKLSKRVSHDSSATAKTEPAPGKRKGRPPSITSTSTKSVKQTVSGAAKKVATKGQKKSKEPKKSDDAVDEDSNDEIWEDELLHMVANEHEYKAMKETWETLDTHSEAWPFQMPVEEKFAPGYFNIIKRPMDLSTIEEKILEKKYKTVGEFKDDITLMFNNCRLYNGPENEYTEVADTLDKLFQKTLFISLTKQPIAIKPKKGKPGRKKKSAEPVIKEELPLANYTDEVDDGIDVDLDEDDSGEESSDEFTPPGVPKSKSRKRLGSTGRGRGASRGGRGRGKSVGRGRRRSSVPAEAKDLTDGHKQTEMTDSEESNSSSSDTPDTPPSPEKINNKRAYSFGRGRGASRGKSKRGRKSLAESRKNKKTSEESSDESVDEHAVVIKRKPGRPPASARKRGRGRGGYRGRGRGRPRLESKVSRKTTPSSVDSDGSISSSDVEDDGKGYGVSAEKSSIGSIDKSQSMSQKSPNNLDTTSIASQGLVSFQKSPPRDGESSSSTSRASSRSRSPEKAEKMDEGPKAKPLLWSLDYLASQARVLDEQFNKEESSSSKSCSSGKKQSSSNKSSAVDAAARDMKRRDSYNSPSAQSHARDAKQDLAHPEQSDAKMHKSSHAEVCLAHPKTPDVSMRKRSSHVDEKNEPDIYSFNDEVSPANVFTKISNDASGKISTSSSVPGVPGSSNINVSTLQSVQSSGNNASVLPKSPPYASSLTSRRNDSIGESRSVATTPASRHLSSDQLLSPSTASSGYGSNKSASNITQVLPSPLSTGDNNENSRTAKTVDDVSPVNPSCNDLKEVPLEKTPTPKHPSEIESVQKNQVTSQLSNTQHAAVSQVRPVRDEGKRVSAVSGVRASVATVLPIQRPQPNIEASHPVLADEPNKSNLSMTNTNNNARPQLTGMQHPSVPTSTIPPKTAQVMPSRRLSQPMVVPQPNVKSPGYQNTTTPLSGRPTIIDATFNPQRTEKAAPLSRQHSSSANAATLSTNLPQHPQTARLPSYTSQTQPSQHVGSSDRPQQCENPVSAPQSSIDQRQLQSSHNRSYDQRATTNRTAESFRNTTSSSSSVPQQQQQHLYNYGPSPTAPAAAPTNRNPSTSYTVEKQANYHQRGSESSASMNVLNQHPTMASFGLTPQSLSQPPHNDPGGHPPPDPNQTLQRKNSISSGQLSAYPPKATSHSAPAQQQQQQQRTNIPPQSQQPPQRQSTHHYHSSTSTSMSSASSQQHSLPSAGAHHPATKHRNPSTSNNVTSDGADGGNLPPTKHPHRHASNTSSNKSTHSSSGSGQPVANRRQSSNAPQYQQKQPADYMSYIPPTATAGQGSRETRTPSYSSHQQNGLLSAAGAVPNMHPDLAATATLRALQHKSDRSSHAAASMLHYAAAAAAQQSQGAAAAAAANEQYSRLAATAHHRASSQHAHPLAGVYHPHHQNATTSSAHQAAAHLGSPWLQAAAAAPGAGYPSNLIPHPHIDPVYHLMQQSGMHGQYPMYSNPVMQQLHQQHLQHHMLPKY